MDPTALAAALEASALGEWARGSAFAYPLANLVHLLGLVMLLGAIGVLDLRLMGLFPDLPAGALAQRLIPLAVIGFALLIPSGFIMFAADAGPLVKSDVFRFKLAAIAAALVNVAAVHAVWGRRLDRWDIRPPRLAAITAAASLGLWLTAAALGRLIAYA